MKFGVFHGGTKMTSLLKFRVPTSLLTSHVSCPSPRARQNFLAPLKLEQTSSHRLRKIYPEWTRDLAVLIFRINGISLFNLREKGYVF